MRIRTTAAGLAVVVMALVLPACSASVQPTTSPTSASSPAPTGTTAETDEPTPQSTATVTDKETVYVTPTPSPSETTQAPPDGDTVLIGKVVFVKLVELGSDQCDEDYATDVVLQVEDNDRGIRGVQYHDPDGRIGQGGSVGKTVKVTVTPDNYDEITLEQGDEPFPASGSCTQGNVPDSLYGNPFLEDVTYNPLTWEKLPAK